MKKQLFRIFAVVLGLALLAMPSFAQTLLVNTTLGAAVSNSRTTSINLTATTGLTAGSSEIWVDQELMFVNSVPSSGTIVGVTRGYGGTIGASHANAAVVYLIPTNAISKAVVSVNPQGSCTRANVLFLPVINTRSFQFTDCIGGNWTTGFGGATPNLWRYPDPGATALTALETAGTAPSAATEIYCSEVDLPSSMFLTGIAVLNGTTVGTDKHWVILYDNSGKVLANSAAAGVTTANASTYQKMNFTAKYPAVGPARYFACVGTNGTTDTIRHSITAVNDNILGGAVTAQVFGTAAAITVPSTYTTAKAPYFALF